MGKHGTEYARIERDHYPTPHWVVVAALAEHVNLGGLLAWEPACGDGRMVEALRSAGCARVYATDIVARGGCQDEVLDFLSAQKSEASPRARSHLHESSLRPRRQARDHIH
jgi:hypothetical protein